MRITNEFVFFFSYKDFLSNYYYSNFEINNIKFNCVEQYFMYQKALYFNDISSSNEILSAKMPALQKKIGRKVKNFDEEQWNKVSMKIMMDGLVLKFEQNPKLLDKLLQLSHLEFVEASPFDRIWGVRLAEDDDEILDRRNWKGSNHLGILLNTLGGFVSGNKL